MRIQAKDRDIQLRFFGPGDPRMRQLGTLVFDVTDPALKAIIQSAVVSGAVLQLAGGTLTGTLTTVAINANGHITIGDAKNIILNATTGTKIGTATTQKIGFFNATPIVQPANTVSLETVLSSLGLRAAGTAAPIAVGSITITDASDIVLGSTTGTKIGTATTQKLGFFNKAPVTQPAEITDELTTVTHTAPGTPDYAIQDLVNVAPYGFVTKDEGNTLLSVVANLQARVNGLENALSSLGLIADAD